jgi:hypothetical protein
MATTTNNTSETMAHEKQTTSAKYISQETTVPKFGMTEFEIS